jgi:transcriptional regulator with XRE-family HTH domain
MRFYEKLYKQMLLLGMNQQKLARKSQVSDSEVSRILAGKSQPGLENAFKLSRAVGVSLDYLADESLEEDPSQAREAPPAEERDVLELARELGCRQARQLLETALLLGHKESMRRLLSLGLEARPAPVEPADAQVPVSSPSGRIAPN